MSQREGVPQDPEAGKGCVSGEALTVERVRELLARLEVAEREFRASRPYSREREARYGTLLDARGELDGLALAGLVFEQAEELERLRAAHAQTPAQVEEFCSCEGFQHCLQIGAIKENTHQFLNRKTGVLTQVRYYYIGPKDVRRSVIFHYCPACGKPVKVNVDFYATPGLFTEPRHDQ